MQTSVSDESVSDEDEVMSDSASSLLGFTAARVLTKAASR